MEKIELQERKAERARHRWLALVEMCLRHKPGATLAEIKAWIAELDTEPTT